MLINDWAKFCVDLACNYQKHSKPNTKTFNGMTFSVAELDNSLELKLVGYKETSNRKMSQLKMHYYNRESVREAVNQYKAYCTKKQLGSVGMSTRGERSGDKKQDFCIQSIVISTLPNGNQRADIFYRNTEVIKKYAADLVFFRDIILPHFDLKKTESVNFYFANAQLNALFYPLIIPHDSEWVQSLARIKKADPHFYKNILRWSIRYLDGDGDKYKFIRRVQESLPIVFTPQQYKNFELLIRRLANEGL